MSIDNVRLESYKHYLKKTKTTIECGLCLKDLNDNTEDIQIKLSIKNNGIHVHCGWCGTQSIIKV